MAANVVLRDYHSGSEGIETPAIEARADAAASAVLPQGRLAGLKVVFVLPTLGRGGAERQAFLLARHLQHREGAEVLLVSLGPTGGIGTLAELAGLRCVTFEMRHRAGARLDQVLDLARFARLLRRESADIVLPYCMFPNVFSALTWRIGGARACIWSQRDEGRDRLEGWVEWLATRSVSCFVSNSHHAAGFLTGTLGRRPEDVHVIPNGIETPAAGAGRETWRAARNLPSQAFVATMVATLHPFKDHPTLIAAWRPVVTRLQAQGREAHLLLAGEWGSRHPQLVEQVASLGLESHVHFLGEVEDTGSLLRSIDLFTFSSFNEGVPNAVLEAMACGLAVAGTDYAGIREAIGDEGAVLLAPPRDAEALADRIVQAALDPELCARLGRAGQERVRAHFSIEAMCDRTVRLIRAQLPTRDEAPAR